VTRLLDPRAERDAGSRASQAFYVLAIELDGGTLFLSGRGGDLGSDALLAALLTLGDIGPGGGAAELERQALPDWATRQWWINREVAILECTPDMGSVYDGTIVFDGVVAAHPTESAGVLSVAFGVPRMREVALPDHGIVEAGAWPLASDAAMGMAKPAIIGTVEDCPLLAVALPPATRLARDANPGDGQLEVEDAADLAAPGSVMVDGVAYAYDAKSAAGNILLGVTITGCHRQGTACVAVGATVFLAAGHTVAAIDDIRDGATAVPIPGGLVDLAAATVTFAEPPLLVERSERFSLTAQLDQVGAGATAVNAVNAIRAVTGTVAQYAGVLPAGITAALSGAGISFGRPSGRIVKGIYTVAFSVNIGAQVGWARVRIGNEVVWAMEPPASVLYEWSPATILFDDDTDLLPVVVEVEQGGTTDQVGVTIISASRVVSLGNLDDANFAILRGPANLLWRGEQTDALPDRGRIAKARLWVRWFAAGAAALPSAAASFAGRALGTLAQTQLPNATLSQTISVDVTSQGAASLPQQPISTVVSGGVTSLSHALQTYQASVTAPSTWLNTGAGVYRAHAAAPSFDGWSYADGGPIVVRVLYQASSLVSADNSSYVEFVEFRTISGWSLASYVSTEEVVAGNLYARVYQLPQAPSYLRFVRLAPPPAISMTNVAFQWNGKITLGSVAAANTPAAGYSAPIAAQALGNSGISVAANNGTVNFTVPAPPRVVDSLFDLSWVREWPDLIGQAEISYTAGGPDLCLNQVALIVEYDALVHVRTDAASAMVTGSSGNPADVIALLAGATGQRAAAGPLRDFRSWCAANGYTFGRRLAERIDALTLLSFAAEQANVLLADTGAGLAPLRLLDRAPMPFAVSDADLVEEPVFGYTDRADTDITVRYREGASGMTRVVRVDAASNASCRAGLAATTVASRMEIDAGFIRADAVAATFASDTARLHGRPRRTVALALTYAFGVIEQGDLIEYVDVLWRVMDAARDNGFVRASCIEVPE
jgi:hypothetical protein